MQLKFLTAIAVLLLVVATSACIQTTTRNEGQTQAASYTPTSTNTPAGQPTVSVTATYLGESSTLNSNYGTATVPASGYKFVKYAIYCQNINAQKMSIGNPYSLRMRDTEGNLYNIDSYTFSLQEQQVNGKTLKGLSVETDTQPGDKMSGMVVFQIPTSAKPQSLTYDDYTNKITINL
jgi:hypothetical protein